MSQSPITLELARAYWLGDDPWEDLCAHGDIALTIGGVVVPPEATEGLCVSAAAMNLLRTLARDHTEEAPVSEKLLPHCGHVWMEVEGRGLVNIVECPHGYDVEVRHRDGRVVLIAEGGAEAEVTEEEWAGVVCAFADAVEEHYRTSEPKKLKDDDFWYGWYEPFWREWRERRARAAAPA